MTKKPVPAPAPKPIPAKPGKTTSGSASSLAPGDPAPPFKLPAAGGAVSLKSLKGKIVVLFFYPKDDTTACTEEALNFTEKAAAFSELNAVLVGISRDPVASHEKFIAKHSLDLTLASDEDAAVCGLYGVWTEKSMYGRKYMGIERSTFLINQRGALVKMWRKVKVKGHVDEVLTATRAIKG